MVAKIPSTFDLVPVSRQTDEETPGAAEQRAKARKLTGFANVARQLSSRTTDFLAIAIVLIGGFTIGGQVSRWWSADADNLAADLSAKTNLNWGSGQAPVWLEFGEVPYSVRRQVIVGEREEVFAKLVERCGLAAQETAAPAREFPSTEKQLLKQLARLKPIWEEVGQWAVFRIETPLTLVIGTRDFASQTGTARARMAAEKSNSPAASRRRVVCWGFAYPSGKTSWTAFSFRPIGERLTGLPQITLPAGSRKVLGLRDALGGELIAFEGTAPAEYWIGSFNHWFDRHDWRPAQAWEHAESRWSASFIPAEPAGAAGGRIEVSFCRHGDTGLSGLLSLAPAIANSPEKRGGR